MDGADLKRRCEVAEALCELSAELLQLDDYDAMLDILMRHVLAMLRADRGFVVLRGAGGMEFKVVRNWSREELEEARDPISQSIVAEVLRVGRPLLVEDARTDSRFRSAASVQDLEIRSVLAAPLAVEGKPAGALYVESGLYETIFTPRELEVFERVLGLARRALEVCARRLVLEQRLEQMERDFLASRRFPGIITRDEGFLRLLQTVAQVAAGDVPVLVQGPSGSGKELIVRALWQNSPRAGKPFLAVNCGAIAQQLLESELFGHVRGAFTGASSDRLGLLRSADGGTVFLDEIGELPAELQVKLLRTLQFGEVQPVGSSVIVNVDVRFLAATNRDLSRDVQSGRFRQDLYYRLNAITLELPPLRARSDDVLPLFYHFLSREAERASRPVPDVTPRLERVLQAWDWPGNVRELENETRRLLALTPPGLPLTVERLSRRVTGGAPSGPATAASLEEQEKELIELHLRLAQGNRSKAARSLGISRDGLRRKMLRLGLAREYGRVAGRAGE